MIKPQKFTSTVVEKKQLTDRVYEVHFKLDTPPEITFVAGQTMMLMVAPGVNRSMSIASVPSEKNVITMLHDISPMGPGSKWTLGLHVGDKAQFMAPLGMFVIDKESHKKKVFVATGTGSAPFFPMVTDYYEHGGTDNITLYWGMRFEHDVYWFDHFQKLSEQYPQFRVVLSLSKPSETWAGKRGRVTDHVVQEEQNVKDSEFYLCGSHAMVDDIKAQLASCGVPSEQIKTELYF